MSDAPPYISLRRSALRIAAIYALVSVVWIALSDYLVEFLLHEAVLQPVMQTSKGLLFIAVTAWLLYSLIVRDLLRIQRTEQRYRTLFESSHDALLVFDRDGRYLDANAAALQLTGYTRSELLERTVVDLAPPDQRAATMERLRDLAQQHANGVANERRILLKDGRIIPVESRIAVQTLLGEHVYVSAAHDITEQRQAADALQQSEARFRTLFEHAPLGVGVARNGIHLYVNSAYTQMFGYDDPAEIIGLPITMQVSSETRAVLAERNRQREAGEDVPSTYEMTGQRRDGSQIICQMHVTQMELPDGPASVAFVTDITARKQVETRVQQQSERASALAEISRLLAEHNLDHHAILTTVTERTSAIVGDGCAIRLLAADGQTLEVATSYHRDPELRALLASLLVDSPLPITELSADAADMSKPPSIGLLTSEQLRDRIRPELRAQFAPFGTHHGVAVALRAHGRILGSLTVIRHEDRPVFDDEEQRFIQELADRAALAVDNARLYYASQQEILERRRIEVALRDSEATLRAIFDSAHQSIMLLGPDYRLLTFNKYAQLGAISNGNDLYVGQSILELIPPKDHQTFIDHFALTIRGESYVVEYEFRTTRGTEWWECYFNPIVLPTGDVNAITFTARNITARKQAELELRQAEERLRMVVTNAPIGLVALDCHGTITLAQGTGLESLQLTPADLVGRSALEVYPDGDVALHLQRALTGQTSTSIDRRGAITFDTRWTPLRDLHDTIVGAIAVSTDVSEREQAMARLRETETREQAILHGTTDPIYLKDRAGRYLQVNPASAKVMGCTIEEALGKTDAELFPAGAAEHFAIGDRRVLESGQQIETEEALLVDGKLRSFLTLKAPYRDAYGTIQGVIGISRDVTEMKQTIEALRKSEATKHALLNAIPDLMFRVSHTGCFLDFHTPKHFEAILTEPIGKTLAEVVPDAFLEQTETCIARALATGEIQTRDFQIMFGGRPYEFETRFVGCCEDEVLIIASDMTERRRMERTLRDTRDVYLTLVDEMPMLVWRLNRDGKLDFTNKRWIEFTGYDAEHVPDNPSDTTMHPLDRDSCLEALYAAWRDRQPFNMECRLCRHDDVYRWMDVRGSAFYDENGHFAGYVGTCSDISDRKRQEQIKDDFLALASHELKTPLAALIGYIHLLERWSQQDGFSGRINQALDAMSAEGVRLNRLINDLLDVSRIQTGKLHMFMHPVNLTELLQHCLATLQVMLPDYRWIVEIAPEPLIITADAQRIEQVLTNLCTNAAKYSAEHAPIQVKLCSVKQQAQITVQDRGLGIPHADLPYIFDRFYQVQRPARESRPGLGLGLFIAHEIIRQHGGSITVDSNEHSGSIFTILLPLEQTSSQRA